MKKLIKVLIGLIVILSLYGCFNLHLSRGIGIYNNSNKNVYWLLQLSYNVYYPDTTIQAKITNFNMHKVEPGKGGGYDFGEYGYHEDHLFNQFPADTLSVFFFDADIVENDDWETIQKDYKILVRYDLSQKDFQSLNWDIPYPPTEAMRNMKMYPPYGSQ